MGALARGLALPSYTTTGGTIEENPGTFIGMYQFWVQRLEG